MNNRWIYIVFYICSLYMVNNVYANSNWISNEKVSIDGLGKKYNITEYGVLIDSTLVQTEKIQSIIDKIYKNGGGTVYVPSGTFQSGSLFFLPGVNLFLERGAKLKGSERIRDYKLVETRLEGKTIKYFAALINANNVDGFCIAGPGVIDGNGHYYWEEFWLRSEWNPGASSMDTMRPRLIYISNSQNVILQDIIMQNSALWTSHLYKCTDCRFLNCSFFAPTENVYSYRPYRGAPSTDGIDIDNCNNIYVCGCYFSVNDDAIALKGGKGTYADMMPDNGPNFNIVIDNCTFDKGYGCLTLGSESIWNYDIVLKNSISINMVRLLRLKMRKDTPQKYEKVTIENIQGYADYGIDIQPWTQFADIEDREDMPPTECSDIIIKGLNMNFKDFFHVQLSDDYNLDKFSFLNSVVTDETGSFKPDYIEETKVENFIYNGKVISTDESVNKIKELKNNSIENNESLYGVNGIKTNLSNIIGIIIKENKKLLK